MVTIVVFRKVFPYEVKSYADLAYKRSKLSGTKCMVVIGYMHLVGLPTLSTQFGPKLLILCYPARNTLIWDSCFCCPARLLEIGKETIFFF